MCPKMRELSSARINVVVAQNSVLYVVREKFLSAFVVIMVNVARIDSFRDRNCRLLEFNPYFSDKANAFGMRNYRQVGQETDGK